MRETADPCVLADQIAEARGWKCRAQTFGPYMARLMVVQEGRWLGLTVSPVHEAGHLDASGISATGQPTDPLVESVAFGTVKPDLEELLREVELVWHRLASCL